MTNNYAYIRMFKSAVMLLLIIMLPAIGVRAQSANDSVLQELYEAQRYNDSISAIHKDLQISDYKAKMDALEQEEETEREELFLVIIIAIMAVSFFAVYANNRRKQLSQLRQAYDKLEETTAAKERIDSELRIASEIQMAMVPHEFPRYPGLDLYATMLPAAIAHAMNQELCTNNDNFMFVTMFIGQLDLWNGRLKFCNCGHNPPVLDSELIEMESNAPLGLWPDMKYEQQHIDDIRGQRFFVYSDGLSEAEDQSLNQFGEEQMLEWLRKHPDTNSKDVIDIMLDKVGLHKADAEQSDDLTILCVKYDN